MNFVAKMLIDGDTGLVKVNPKTGHVDIWMYESFEPHISAELVALP